MPRLADRAEAEAQMTPCEKAIDVGELLLPIRPIVPLFRAVCHLVWAALWFTDVAGIVRVVFAEGMPCDAQTKQ